MQNNQPAITEESSCYYFRVPVVVCIISVLLLIGLVFFSQPGSGGPALVLAFLFLCFTTFVSLFAIILQLGIKAIKRPNISALRVFYTSVVAGIGAVLLLGLKTLGQMQTVDVVLVTVFELLLNFYLLRRF